MADPEPSAPARRQRHTRKRRTPPNRIQSNLNRRRYAARHAAQVGGHLASSAMQITLLPSEKATCAMSSKQFLETRPAVPKIESVRVGACICRFNEANHELEIMLLRRSPRWCHLKRQRCFGRSEGENLRGGEWELPGGRVREDDVSLSTALERAIQETTGLKIVAIRTQLREMRSELVAVSRILPSNYGERRGLVLGLKGPADEDEGYTFPHSCQGPSPYGPGMAGEPMPPPQQWLGQHHPVMPPVPLAPAPYGPGMTVEPMPPPQQWLGQHHAAMPPAPLAPAPVPEPYGQGIRQVTELKNYIQLNFAVSVEEDPAEGGPVPRNQSSNQVGQNDFGRGYGDGEIVFTAAGLPEMIYEHDAVEWASWTRVEELPMNKDLRQIVRQGLAWMEVAHVCF